MLDDGYNEIGRKVLWAEKHNKVLADVLRHTGVKVASSVQEFEELLRKDAKKKALASTQII